MAKRSYGGVVKKTGKEEKANRRAPVDMSAAPRIFDPYAAAVRPGAWGEYQYNAIIDPHRMKLYAGGMRSGKSLPQILEMHEYCLDHPGCIFWVVRSYERDIKKSIWKNLGDFLKIFEKKSGFRMESTETPPCFRYPNGSRIDGVGADRIMSFMGVGIDGVLFDQLEDLSEESFQAIMTRTSGSELAVEVREAGVETPWKPLVLANCNHSHGWLDTKVVVPWETKPDPEDCLGFKCWFMSAQQNKSLDTDYLPKQLRLLGQDEFNRRYGSLRQLRMSGAVLPPLTEKHFITPEQFGPVPPPDEIHRFMDVGHIHDETFVLFGVIRDGILYLFGEYCDKGRENLPMKVVSRCRRFGRPDERYPLVRSGHDVNKETANNQPITSDNQLFRDAGWILSSVRMDVGQSIDKVCTLFRAGRIRFVKGACPEYLKAHDLYSVDENGKIAHAHSHGPDALRYGVAIPYMYNRLSEGLEESLAEMDGVPYIKNTEPEKKPVARDAREFQYENQRPKRRRFHDLVLPL